MKTLRFRWGVVVGAVVLAAAAMAGCGVMLRRAGGAGTTLAIGSETAPVVRGTLSAVVGATGSVRSNQNATVAWQASGTVGQVEAQLGQTVQADQELASLDAESLSQSLIQAQSDLINAQQALADLQAPQPYQIAQAEAALQTAQQALDDLLTPSATVMAQAETALAAAEEALTTLISPTASSVAQAEQAVIEARSAYTEARNAVLALSQPRGSQEQIDSARATYALLQAKVDRLQQVYDQIPGTPETSRDKALALSQLAAAQSERDRALINLNWLTGKPSAEEIAEKQTALALAEARLADATATLETLKHPAATDIALAQAKVADAQETLEALRNPQATDIALAQAKVADAQETLDKLKNGPSADDLTVAQNRVTLAQAALNQGRLLAPFAGTITEVQVMAGDTAAPGKAAFRIDDLSKLFIDLQVSEIDIHMIQVGQPVSITLDAVPEKTYAGQVTGIGLIGGLDQGAVYFDVTVQLTNPDAAVKPGMTANANVVVAQVENVLQVPNLAIQIENGQEYVYVMRAEGIAKVVIKTGLVSDTMSEVISDELKAGDQVLMSLPTTTEFQGGGFIMGGGERRSNP
jgi:HlyD family secretion protein